MSRSRASTGMPSPQEVPNKMYAQRPDPLPSAHGTAVGTTVVVAGVDGSETSWDAFWWACGEVRRLGGRLVAVFVSPTPMVDASAAAACTAFTGMAVAQAGTDERATDEAEHLRDRVERYAAEADLDVSFVHAHGDATNELLQVAQAEHADLIVVGRSTKVRHHIAGSLGRRLIGKREVPVVVVVP